jgi:quinol monooxygenase YgiN
MRAAHTGSHRIIKTATEQTMERLDIARPPGGFISRRSALAALGAALAAASGPPAALSQTRPEQNQRAMDMTNYSTGEKTVRDAVASGRLLVVAQWETKEGQSDKVAAILDRFLPEAQREPGVSLFLIARGTEKPEQFLFYELFRDEAAFKAHQESAHFKTYIAGQALPLLAKRERGQYILL